jgi:hypothetical protein
MSPSQAQLTLLESLAHAAAQDRVWAVATTAFGLLAILLAMACWLVWARPLALGAAMPLVLLGGVFAIAGAVDFVTLSKEEQALPERLQEAPHLLTSQTLPSALEAIETRRLLRFADGLLLVLSLGLLTRRERLFGIGLGLFVMSSSALALDSVAIERHAERVNLIKQVDTFLLAPSAPGSVR